MRPCVFFRLAGGARLIEDAPLTVQGSTSLSAVSGIEDR